MTQEENPAMVGGEIKETINVQNSVSADVSQPRLAREHVEELHASGISDEVIANSGVFTAYFRSSSGRGSLEGVHTSPGCVRPRNCA